MKLSIRNNTNALQKRGDKKKQQCVKNTRSSIKQQLQKKFSQDWFEAQNDISDSSRQKYTNKEIKSKKDYRQLVGRLFRK